MTKRFRASFVSKLSLQDWLALWWLSLFTLVALSFPFWHNSTESTFLHPEKAYLPPFQEFEFALGTDNLGRNLLFYLLHSCQTAWLLAFPPLVVANVVGIGLGVFAGYLGNSRLKVAAGRLISVVVILAVALWLAPVLKWHLLPELKENLLLQFSVWLLYVLIFLALAFFLQKFLGRTFQRKLAIPFDGLVRKAVEIWSALPKLLLLLLLSALAPNSIWVLMGWIAFSFWVLPCQISRAKVLEMKSQPYIETARTQGLPTWRIFHGHLLPFLKGPLLVNFCFNASGLLGIGATLSFLGVGLPPETPSWGKLLATSRLSVEAWWLFFFPALLLLLTILSLQAIGHKFSAKSKS